MQLKISKSELLRGLRLAAGVADKKGPVPMLANVLLQAGEGKLVIAATDLTVSVVAELKAVVTKQGAVTVEAKKLNELINNCPADEISITSSDNSWIEIKSGRTVYKQQGAPDKEFPKIPDHSQAEFVDIESSNLRELITHVEASVASDIARVMLTGAILESNGTVSTMVSTDGHRLSRASRPLALNLADGIIIPAKGMTALRRLLEPGSQAGVGKLGDHLFTVQDGIVMGVKLINAQFPPWKNFIPTTFKRTWVGDRVAFSEALRRAQSMSPDTGTIRLEFAADGISMTSTNPKAGESRDFASGVLTGDPLTIGVNVAYMIEMLGQMSSEQVTISLGEEVDPAILTPVGDDSYLAMIMLIRL